MSENNLLSDVWYCRNCGYSHSGTTAASGQFPPKSWFDELDAAIRADEREKVLAEIRPPMTRAILPDLTPDEEDYDE